MMSNEKDSAEKAIRDIRRATRRQYSVEEKIRIVLGGLRGVQRPEDYRPRAGRYGTQRANPFHSRQVG